MRNQTVFMATIVAGRVVNEMGRPFPEAEVMATMQREGG